MTQQPIVQATSVDYSSDELDALASAFLRPDLARRSERVGGSAIERAQHGTALRGLVARHAIALGGQPGKPRITFLEPHATLLDAFLNAGAVATIRTEARLTRRAVSLFAADDAVVHRSELPGQEIHRLTAYPRLTAADLLVRELGLGDATDGGDATNGGASRSASGDTGPAEPAGAGRFDLSRAALGAAVRAIEAEKPAPRDVPAGAADVLYARRSSGSVSISARARDGARIIGSWTWIDAGDLGFWKVAGVGNDDSYVSMLAISPAELIAELGDAWAEVLAESAPV